MTHAVAVAVERDAEVGLLRRAPAALERCGRGGADAVVDVEAVGLDADRDDVGAELVEHVRRDVVGGAVRAVDHDLQALEVELVREGALAELDVAAAGVVDAGAPCRASPTALQPIGCSISRLDRRFDLVGQLEAVAGEELDAVVLDRDCARR